MRKNNPQPDLALDPATEEHLTVSAMEQWLWSAACVICGATDAPKFKDFILPLVFFKRLSDVFDDEMAEQIEEYGDAELAQEVIEADHAAALKDGRKPILRFYIPEAVSWRSVRNHAADGSLGEYLTDCLREISNLNPEVKGVLDVKDFNERQAGQRSLDDERLAALIEIISRHRLGLKNTKPDVLGHAYEYLLRKFAEGQGQSAGEFYTPFEAGLLMSELIDPAPYSTIYDPTCGSGGLLIKARIVFERKHPDKRTQAPRLYGQELNPVTYAMAKMNMVLHDYSDSQFAIGDTFRNPGFGAQGAGLQQFDYVVANPMWNQKNYTEAFYENDSWKRFANGVPPSSSADWGWVQHILASLKEGGRAAIVLDTGAVSRGSGSDSSNKERTIRKKFADDDLIEGVVLMPENLFYNTTAPGIILLLRKGKPEERKGQTILINASQFFVKEKPKNVLAGEVAAVSEVFERWETREKLSRVVTLEEIRAADYNLSPSQFVEVGERMTHRPLSEILADLDDAKAERERADAQLLGVLAKLGLIAEVGV